MPKKAVINVNTTMTNAKLIAIAIIAAGSLIAVAIIGTGVMVSRSIPPKNVSPFEEFQDTALYAKMTIEADRRTAEVQVGNLASSLKMYAVDMKTFPLTEEGLDLLVSPPEDATLAKKWDGPYIEGGKLPKDPWGHPFNYEDISNGFRVWCTDPTTGKDIEYIHKK